MATAVAPNEAPNGAPAPHRGPAREERSLRTRRFFRRLWRERSAYLFIAPGLIIFSVFTLAALVFAFYLTFHRWSIIEPDKPYVGMQNYEDMVHDERFVQAVLNTAYFAGASVPVTMLIGLGLALLLNQPLRGRAIFRTAYYLPVVTPFVVSALLWKWLYNGDFGLFNYYLVKGHIIDEPLLWLSDKDLAMPAVILMSVWSGVGFSMVVYLAGLQSIPYELYESAKLDGAGAWGRIRHVTIPLLRPTTLFLLVMGIIGSLQVFTQIFVMTSGGPVNKTTTMVYYMYLWAFKYYDMGYASTLAFALFAMLLVFTAFQLRLFRDGGSE
ncbi:ABC transporter permease subunit [Nocardioides sp. zg-579]|uniref:ABC transporter permease subunit n=1 Tax=Nocardioides marmotae TaxID=2663857 RepID=A0A6I3JCH4_9ACTN|nr:sugar ABC transporter permease [Nocardioides marmotae]MCR6032129.1 ABC transporter permease subunit [Gordonia jinghuaiqii]MTB95775.1 ABC transporter permease subunit [Nocardioides marmotae]QKE02864.1 sugar ABC transporter permease [Nocardioides marmotae]